MVFSPRHLRNSAQLQVYRIRKRLPKTCPTTVPALVAIFFLCTVLPESERTPLLPVPSPLPPIPIHDPIAAHITIGIKTYVCDTHGVALLLEALRAIRFVYPFVRIVVGNDGPLRLEDSFITNDPHIDELILPHACGSSISRNAIVHNITTQYVALFDDDHQVSLESNMTMALQGLQAGNFDVVGLRVHNLPGFRREQLLGNSTHGIVANVSKIEGRVVTLCVWREDDGLDVSDLRMPMPVDVVHSALIAKTQSLRRRPYRKELKLNEQLTFFLDAKRAGLKVGYLPSVIVQQSPRYITPCYQKTQTQAQEDEMRTLAPYSESFSLDDGCIKGFPLYVEELVRSERHLL